MAGKGKITLPGVKIRSEQVSNSEGKITLGTVQIRGFARVRVYADLPSDHPFYADVGLVASEWAHFEHVLDLIIWDLAEVHPVRGACITANIMGAPGRCKAIATLASQRRLSETLVKRTRRLMNDSYLVADRRARLVHDPWYLETTDGDEHQPAQFKSMAYSDQRHGLHAITKDEIKETLKGVRALKATALALHRDFLDALATSREKPR